jgi:hypothetical protein
MPAVGRTLQNFLSESRYLGMPGVCLWPIHLSLAGRDGEVCFAVDCLETIRTQRLFLAGRTASLGAAGEYLGTKS